MKKRVILVNCYKDLIDSVADFVRNGLAKNRIVKIDDLFRSTETYIETKNYLIVISDFQSDPTYALKNRECHGVCNFNSYMCSYLRKFEYRFLNVGEMIEHVIEHEKAIKMISLSIYGASSPRQIEKVMDVNSLYPSIMYNSGIGYAKHDVDSTFELFSNIAEKTSLSLKSNNNTIHIEHMIKKVIFNEPATIVIWNDGTKTIVKAEGEVFDPEKGLAMAISKKVMGNNGKYYNVFKKWTNKYYAKKSD